MSQVTERLETSNLDSKQTSMVPLGTLPEEVVMSLAHNHMTNLFISSYRWATVIKFGQ